MMDIRGKHIVVLGAARSGVAAATLLSRKGAQVFLSEQAPLAEKAEQYRVLEDAGIASEFGGHSDRIQKADLWVVSPGIPVDAPVFNTAKERNILVFSELEAASWFCRSPIVAITGTNGKSTVTTLLGEVFKAAGRPCVVAGNIGEPFSDVADKIGEKGVAVVEVSSFQLETIAGFHPKVAVILNLTPDHLDRHGSMKKYGEIKSRIFENQNREDFLVYNGEDPRLVEMVRDADSRKAAFHLQQKNRSAGFIRDGKLVLRLADSEEEIIATEAMRIRGPHNLGNSLAVALSARMMGTSPEPIQHVLRTFRGLSHRMELVRVLHGVEWINDSKATNVDAVWHALGSFSNPVILIAGGRDKDSDFTQLRDRLRENVRYVVLIGEAAEKMRQAFEGICPLVEAASFKEAVAHASQMAVTGDTVLLSPGCASFDWFQNFEDRGDQFKTLVDQLT